jgi:predicted MFS family arabinose efflux permease
MGLMGIFAASIAGLLIASLGAAVVYVTMAALYVMALFTISRLPLTGPSDTTRNSVWADLRLGVSYLLDRPTVLALMAVALVRVLVSMPYSTLMPKYARDVLQFDARGLGVLSAAPGLGSLFSAMRLAALGNSRNKGRLLLSAGALMGVALLVFALSRNFLLVLAALVVVGAAGNSCMVANQTLIQANCVDRFRGRVLSMYMMTWGLTPLGTIPAGALADRFGVPVVVAVQGVVTILAFAAIWAFRPALRQME